MIDGRKISEIFALYKRHGWLLRRVLLTPETRNLLAGANLFAPAEVFEADIDAAWFSRPSGAEREAWELRLLSENPYALLEIFEADDDEEVREEARFELQARLSEMLGKSARK